MERQGKEEINHKQRKNKIYIDIYWNFCSTETHVSDIYTYISACPLNFLYLHNLTKKKAPGIARYFSSLKPCEQQYVKELTSPKDIGQYIFRTFLYFYGNFFPLRINIYKYIV